MTCPTPSFLKARKENLLALSVISTLTGIYRMQCIEDLQYGRHKNGIVYQPRKVIVTETVLDISSKYERLKCGSKDALLLQLTFPNTSKSIETIKDKVAKAEETLDI
jgi:hypothetical protein